MSIVDAVAMAVSMCCYVTAGRIVYCATKTHDSRREQEQFFACCILWPVVVVVYAVYAVAAPDVVLRPLWGRLVQAWNRRRAALEAENRLLHARLAEVERTRPRGLPPNRETS